LHWQSRSDDESSSKVDLVWGVESSSLFVFSFINIFNLPFLTELIDQFADSYVLALSILLVGDLDDSAIFFILEVVLRVLEFLEPSSISGPDLQVSSVTRVLDVEGFVFLQIVFDCLGLLVEEPDLGIKFIWSLDNQISTDDINVSLLTAH